MKETAVDRDGKMGWFGSFRWRWDGVVKDREDVVGSGGEGKTTTRVVYSKNHLNLK